MTKTAELTTMAAEPSVKIPRLLRRLQFAFEPAHRFACPERIRPVASLAP